MEAYEAAKERGWVGVSDERLMEMPKQEQGEPVAWAEEIIDDFYALYNSEMIKENNSGDELIRLDAAICVVEEAAQRHTTPPQQRTWVELTDDEQISLLKESDGKTRHCLVWQVEAKLKQNNGYNT